MISGGFLGADSWKAASALKAVVGQVSKSTTAE
jgi:hypothetical protein